MTDCKKCKNCVQDWLGDVGCIVLRDWLTHSEYKQKKILDNCPLKEEQ